MEDNNGCEHAWENLGILKGLVIFKTSFFLSNKILKRHIIIIIDLSVSI